MAVVPPANRPPDEHLTPLPWWLAPWRSAALGWAALAAVLVAGVPLFLRMPLWVDVTMYDVAARAVLAGGGHYRDVFDTNPPGVVWCLCLIRLVFGTTPEAVRAVDLAAVGGAVAVLLGWARAAGASRAGVAWAAAGAAGLYLFAPETAQAQRDGWMLLPAAAAARLRVARADRAAAGARSGWVFRTGVLEGLVWGLGVWIKPHLLLVAVAVWAATAGRFGRGRRAADLAGAVAGGLLAGGAGVGFLVWSGSWPYYWDVLTNWNVTYVGIVLAGLESRIALQWRYFPPWSTLMVATLPLAAFNLLTDGRGRPAPGRPPGWLYLPADGRAGAARRALAAMFLGWTATAYVLQQPFPYIHLPETLLMLAVLAANGWGLAAPAALLVQAAGVAVLTVGPSVAGRPVPADRRERYVLGRLTQVADDHPNRLRWWAGCWSREVPPELRNGLAFRAGLYYDPDWVGLAEVADYLRGRGVRPGDADVLCWDTTPHVLYLDLGLRPPVRFLHVTTATEWGPGPTARVRDELAAAAPRVRLVVGDIKALSWRLKPVDQLQLSEPGVDLLPPLLPPEYRAVFPMNQRAVFRSAMGRGRYVVYELVNPVGEIDLPLPGAADTGKAG